MTPLAREGGLAAVARARLAALGPMPSGPLAREVMALSQIDEDVAERLVGTLLGGDRTFERTGDGRWRLAPGAAAAAARSIREIPFVVVDVETTGGRPPGDRVIEIGAVRVRGSRIEGEWSSLIDPGRGIPPFVSRLTGIANSAVAAAPGFERIVDEFLEFLGGAAFVAHNARFDWRFVNAELLRVRGGRLTNARLCTVRLTRRLLPHVKRRNLDALAWLFGIQIDGRHRALPDARATARILLALLDVAEEIGVADEVDLAALGGVDGTLWPARPY
jgi:DNA polymerase III epsilon subunit family exonuclease